MAIVMITLIVISIIMSVLVLITSTKGHVIVIGIPSIIRSIRILISMHIIINIGMCIDIRIRLLIMIIVGDMCIGVC